MGIAADDYHLVNKQIENIIRSLENLKVHIVKEYKAELVGLFGSYARGEQKESSDVDILVRFLEGATLLDFVGLADFLEQKLKMKVDIVPIDTVREEIKERVFREAVYL